MADEINPELETFRKQWQQEVTARSKGPSFERPARPSGPPKKASGSAEPFPSVHPAPSRNNDDAEEESAGRGYHHDLVDKDEARQLGEEGEGIHPSNHANREPKSALEHYEKAVEKESQGNLGDSLKLYRKAYRLDSGVDRIYKNKHFPPSSFKSKPSNPNPPNASVTVPNPAHHSLDGPPAQCSIPELIASFSSLLIASTPPPTDQSPPPSCPIATMPSELLINILHYTAVADVASFARLALVCKRLAYLIATEDQIWKRVCLGAEYGFSAMHYRWNCTVSGDLVSPYDEALSDVDDANIPSESNPNTPLLPSPSTKFPLTPIYPTYKTMFHMRPRLRFCGCYISTVNYIRPGASMPSQASWNTPVHVVTYYRYLRFFRDGSCISLQTTTEPADVVHHLTKPNLDAHHAGGLPSAVMNHALRGRWHLSGPSNPTPSSSSSSHSPSPPPSSSSPRPEPDPDPEGTLHIESFGVDADKYTYTMRLALRRAGRRAAPHTKLAWRGFWSYNKVTDDWAEFGLRNDRAFFWSRVASYERDEEGA